MEKTWKTIFEPFKVKAVEPLPVATRAERERALRAAEWNLARVPADKILIDLAADSGPSAMSAEQWAALMRGGESGSGARGFHAFEAAARDLTGMRHVLPMHAGRAVERVLFKAAGGAGRALLSNSLGATARANAEAAGARAIDLPTLEALDPASPAPFKGDVDPFALEAKIRELGPAKVAMIVMTVTNDALGGQPVSMGNLRAAREISRTYKIPLFLDASRFAENSWLVKLREHGYSRRTAAEIARETFAVADGCWMSAKMDASSNSGGFLALNDGPLAEASRAEMIVGEGAPTSGGLASRDLESLTVGLAEALDEGSLSYRARSIERLAEGLRAAGVPIVEPPGGHAVLLDARRLLPHLPPDARPARALARELYLTAGVRGAEDGARAEFVRLAVPRRTYTHGHLELVLEAVTDVASRAVSIVSPAPGEPEAVA